MTDFLQWFTIFILFLNYYATRKKIDRISTTAPIQNSINGRNIVQVHGGKDITINGQDVTKKKEGMNIDQNH